MIELHRPSQVRQLPRNEGVGNTLNGVLECLEKHVAQRCPFTPAALAKDAVHMAQIEESDPEALLGLLTDFLPTFQSLFPREKGLHNVVVFALGNCRDGEALRTIRTTLSDEGYSDAGLVVGVFELRFTTSTGIIDVTHAVWTLIVRHLVETDFELLMKQMVRKYGSGTTVVGIYPALGKLLELYPHLKGK